MAGGALGLAGCGDDDGTAPMSTTFTVTIDNVSPSFDFLASGVFDTPDGSTTPGAIGPGQSYTFRVGGLPGDAVSFATMFVQSNDLFFAPAGAGIALYDASGNPRSGDVTAEVMLWDAGTEANQEPGVGADQAPRQAAANAGAADANPSVRVVNDGFTYPAVGDVIEVTLTPEAGNLFQVRLRNVSQTGTLMTSTGMSLAVPMAPGVYVVHGSSDPLFTAGAADRGEGLEALAEDGDPAVLAQALASRSGVATPFAPGVWAVHTGAGVLFTPGMADRGEGLEALAEDGDPAALAASLAAASGVQASGVFDTPAGATMPGPALPGGRYTFTVTASPGAALSFATMFVQSNDLFLAPGAAGIALFAGNTPVSGDVTAQVDLWDAGTEANQFPGVGPDQAPRQTAADTGAPDPDPTVRTVADGFAYPAVTDVIQVTVTPQN